MKKHRIWLTAVLVGFVNAVIFRLFELAVDHGTNGIWNTLFKSNVHRWLVIPLAVIFSIIFSLVVRWVGEKRYVIPNDDLMSSLGIKNVSLKTIGTILLIGLVGLVAGASLGPEAPLMASSAAIGVWAAERMKLDKTASWLVLASVGALLVAFFASLLPMLVPLLLIYKQQKKLSLTAAGVVLVTGITAFITLHFIDYKSKGYGSLPPLPKLTAHDFITAFLVGFAATLLALFLQQCIKHFAVFAKKIDLRFVWPISAALFGLILGFIYLFGGPTVQFSGSAGSSLLVETSTKYTLLGLAGLVLAKLLATSWSKATGYRGGLVFPSIYVAVALGLTIDRLTGGWGGAGVMIGAVSGMLSAVTGSPFIAVIFVASLLPARLFPVAVLAIIGTILGNKLLRKLMLLQPEAKARN